MTPLGGNHGQWVGEGSIGYCRAFGSSPQVLTVGPALPPALCLADIPQPRGHLPDSPGLQDDTATGAGR